MISIVLNHPQMGENIGAAARAMQNFGLTDLRLVAPRDGWPNEKADAIASGAFERMSPVSVFQTLPEALSDLHYVLATTARPRDMVKPVFAPESAAQEIGKRRVDGQNIGLLFGAERTGLLNDDVALAHGIIMIPTNPDFPALNLAQSVLLMAYELAKLSQEIPQKKSGLDDAVPASHQELNYFLERLEDELEKSSVFFKSEDLMPTMKRNIRNIFMRDELTQQEVRTLQGIISALISKQK